jgi:Electron transfer flavoprotein, alpha subunit
MIVVFSEDGENFKSAAALAQSLGEEIAGVAKQELKFTNKLYVTDFDEDVVVDIVSKESPTLVIGGDTKRDKTVAARVAARLRAAYAPSVVDLKSQGDRFVVKRIGYSGVALATLTLSKPAVITVGKGDSSPKEMQTQVIRQEGKGRVRVVERREGKGTVDLGSAKIIVSVGRGMGSKENVKYALGIG